MPGISDAIERFILSLFEETNTTELKRNDLALQFGCAPSQINYVLATRFTEEKGYVIQSRRGGGGYVRIVRVRFHAQPEIDLLGWIGDSLDQTSAMGLVDMMLREGILTQREALICQSMLADRVLPCQEADRIRATLCKSLVAVICAQAKGGCHP